ncbi:NUDIX domain-containing protein [Aquibacillus halophilus]|uniref:NUDIX domain-containing protein n=1 Tax=Aquibacillus halophilus TaxID=930132 RepID=A0A6A8D8T4_9BACI|nr:8-oxo-dGTP diphosphatase [Aquibacillus halophilus]MRH42014.1 NUDIX domain-containing protein [Aquibacillus halophilus]
MRPVTNCIVKKNNHILMLQKPRRGWYAMPGGKMEHGESIKDSVVREYREETGLYLTDPELKGAFTFLVRENKETVDEWMMFTFWCESFEGEMLEKSDEGSLEWVPVEEVLNKPMAAGDRYIYNHILTSNEMVYGTFSYTPDYQLINFNFDPSSP